MPYISGGELYHLLKSYQKFPEMFVKVFIIQIVTAVGYLHELDLVHRDLKLENIMVCDDGYIKLIDFGMATMLKPGERSGDYVGTAEYMAPEILENSKDRQTDKNVDWWAVGIIAYELMFGWTPFFSA